MIIPSTSSMPFAIRATPITPENKTTAITTATWILMIVFIVMFLSREGMKYTVLKKLAIDDLFILLAVLFGIGFSIAALVLASNGFGVLGTLTLRRADAIMKGYYASDLFYILSICFAKLSLVTFFHGILVQQVQRRVVQGLGIFIIAWTLASLIAVAFQCGLPRPWEMMTLHCYNSGAFWIVYCIIDMTTDVCLIMLSVNLVAYLRVRFSRKVVVVACFAPRILVVGAALARLIYLFPITPHDNPEFNLWIPVICTEVQICVSIATACIPYMKPFFEGTEAGAWRADHRRSNCLKVNNFCGYQSGSGLSRGYKHGKALSSMDSTASMSLKYGRTPDVSPRIPSPVPLSPLTPPRYTTPPNSRATTSRSPSERGLKLHIPPPDIMIRRASEITSPKTASSYALSPELLSPHQQPLISPSRFTAAKTAPSVPPRSYSPRPSLSSSPSSSPDGYTKPPAAPRTTRFSLFPQTTGTQYSLLPTVPPKNSPPMPPVPAPRSRSSSRSNRNRISNHRMPANTSHPRSAKPPNFPARTSSLPRNIKSEASIPHGAELPPVPTTAHTSTSTSSPPTIPSYYFKTPPTSSPPNFQPPSPPSPQRLRNYRVLVPQNSSRKDQMSPISPASPTPKTPLTFWRDESSSEGGGLSAGAKEDESPWRAERPWEREPMPIVRKVGRGSPRIVLSRAS